MGTPSAVVAVLEAARAKIERPECWTKGAYGDRDAGDEPRCLVGAVMAVTPNSALKAGREALATLSLAAGLEWTDVFALESWNDAPERTHADVLALYDRALTRAKAGA